MKYTHRIIKKIAQKYQLKHKDLIDINTLKYIGAKEEIELNDLMTVLGISYSGINWIKRSPLNNTRINIFTNEKIKEIEVEIKIKTKEMDKVTLKYLERLSKKYKINIIVVNKILNITKDQIYKLKKGQKYIILKNKNDEKEVISSVIVDEIKYLEYVDINLINYIKQKGELSDKEICNLLKSKRYNYRSLINNKTKKMKIDLLNKYEKIEIEQKLIERFRMRNYITKEEILDFKKEVKTTNKIIKDTLSITDKAFRKLMKGDIKRTRIVFREIKIKTDCIKMDIKYIYGEGFYTRAEIRKLCRYYKLDFDEFLENISTNVKRYPYIKQALKMNKNGLYIGKEHGLSAEFVNKYAKRIDNLCRKITNKYCYSCYLNNEREDIAQEAFILIFQKGGIIEKNFSYDEDLLFNLFANKVKYFVIGKRNKRYKEIFLEDFEKYIGKYDDYSFLNKEESEFNIPMDKRISLLHQKIMEIFQKNKDYIFHNRKNAYKIIAYKLKITKESLSKIINEIKEIYIEYGLAKECVDGYVIDMSDIDVF